MNHAQNIEIGVNVLNIQVPVIGYDWVAQNLRGKAANSH